MKSIKYIAFSSLFILTGGCISQFTPQINEIQEMLVVEGLITDQPGPNSVKLSRSVPLDKKSQSKPLRGCIVTITDDASHIYGLTETTAGTYITNDSEFQGVIGRKYQLKIKVNDPSSPNSNYESVPMEMKPVPPIDSLYYEKITLQQREDLVPLKQGCQIYLDTHDPYGECKYYRWNFLETWETRIPYDVPNRICWISKNSIAISIKNTSFLTENSIKRYPINFISYETGQLNEKYSLLVNQFSISEDEYDYWSRLKSVSEETGGLYDIIPASIIGNVHCTDDPGEQVLGYFSVSAVSSKRIFVKDSFVGLANIYSNCPTDTVYGNGPIPGLNKWVWIIIRDDHAMPPYKVLTDYLGCADCTVRGTNIKPVFWDDDVH